jgi:hypothetical protein
MFTHFKDFAEELKPSLDAAFSSHLTLLLGDAAPLPSSGEAKLLNCGKKIRGSLLCLVTTALGGALESALPRAIAVELIQSASLIHDDFVDQHRTRRNLPAVWTLEGARRAVLLGDIVFSSAIQMMSELGREDGLIVSRAIAEISRGAYQEPLDPVPFLEEVAMGRLDGALYEKIIRLKTGILFGASCQLGAVAALAGEEQQQVWHRYGMRIGEAYQIADDLHDVAQCLLAGSITAGEMAALAPALLHFAGESSPCILEALRHGTVALNGEALEYLQAAAVLMRSEKERRLRLAVEEIDGNLPDNGLCRLVCQAPRDLIRMFDEAMPQVSLP